MNINTFSIIIKESQDEIIDKYVISIPHKIYNMLDEEKFAVLKLGALRINVSCSANNSEDIIFISKEILNNLCLYSDLKTNLLIKNNEMWLGPVIGTFTDSTSVRIASENRPGTKLRALGEANKTAGTILYCFSVDDYIYEQDKIRGTYLNYSTGLWEQRLFPLPDVLYDRGGGSLKTQKAETEKIRSIIEKNENVRKFNPMYIFDKWDTYIKLKKYSDMEQYLPITLPYENPEELLDLLNKSHTIYIKDRTGNRGLGVVRVIKISKDTFELSYFKKKLYKYTLNSVDDLINKINKLFKNKEAIIQKSIDLIKFNDGNVDMRATVQRDGNGELSITAYPVRVGKPEVPITSTRSGSQVYSFEDFFIKFLNYSDEQVKSLMKSVDNFLLLTYKHLEAEYGTFGEIGIDFAIDNSGDIWFIECNAKPGKDTVCLSYNDDTVIRAFLNPIEYCKHLCNF